MKRLYPFLAGGAPRLIFAFPGLAAVCLFVVWGKHEGGFPATSWLPGALLLLGVLLAVLAGSPEQRPFWRSASTWPLVLLGAFTAFSFCSLLWAGVRGDAWDGANRTLLYFIVFLLFSRPLWTAPRAVAVLVVWGLGTLVVGAMTLQEIVHSATPSDFFVGSRLSAPLGYANATAAFFVLPVWPMLVVASRREQPPFVRALCLGVATFLAQLGFVPESRGMLFALPLAVIAYVALCPNRLRCLVPLAVVVLSSVAIHARLLGVYRAHGDDQLRAATLDARNGIVVCSVVLFVVGLIYAIADRRLSISPKLLRRMNLVAVTLVVTLALGGSAAALILDHPARHVTRAWTSFKSPREPSGPSSHFTGLGSNRYDFWRVSLIVFREHPVGGIGADNFAADYLKVRRSHEQPLYPHSLEMRLLAGTGIVGTALFLAFLVSAARAALSGSGRSSATRAVTAGALAAGSYWFLHASGDWLWEFPALGAPAMAVLGLAVGLNATPRGVPSPVQSVRRLAGRAVVALGVVFSAVSLALPWWSEARVQSAVAGWRSHPSRSFDALAEARRVNPLSERPDMVAGAIAARLRDWPRMKRSFERALERDPLNWYSHLELGVLATVNGDFAGALAHLRRAKSLDPREPLIDLALREAGRNRRISPASVNRALLQELPVP